MKQAPIQPRSPLVPDERGALDMPLFTHALVSRRLLR
jgi:hypothetical protein